MLPNDRMFMAFGLARAYEQRKQHDKAFEFLEQGNRVKAEMQPYDDADTGKFVDSLADCARRWPPASASRPAARTRGRYSSSACPAPAPA